MDAKTRRAVLRRAGNRCEYCRLPQAGHDERFSVDHVIAVKHGGSDELSNLALACLRCNLHKGTNLSGIDPESGAMLPLYNPRTQRWTDHFTWSGPKVIGKTAEGRATVFVLLMNNPERVRLREALILERMMHED